MSDQESLVATEGEPNAIDELRAIETEPDPDKGGDVYGWAIAQAALIRAGRYDDVDWVNVADEIDSVGKSELRALTSDLTILLVHMLKWDHQAPMRSRSWLLSIEEHRARVCDDLSDNPGFKNKVEEARSRAYRTGRSRAANETGLAISRFPTTCPYDWDAIMTRTFVLDQTDEIA